MIILSGAFGCCPAGERTGDVIVTLCLDHNRKVIKKETNNHRIREINECAPITVNITNGTVRPGTGVGLGLLKPIKETTV